VPLRGRRTLTVSSRHNRKDPPSLGRIRTRLVEDDGKYATSYVSVADERIRVHVDEELKGGLLRPEPLIQLERAFASRDLSARDYEGDRHMSGGLRPASRVAS
jgi:hypothetical protein